MKTKPNSKDQKQLASLKKGYSKLSTEGKKKDIAMDKAALGKMQKKGKK